MKLDVILCIAIIASVFIFMIMSYSIVVFAELDNGNKKLEKTFLQEKTFFLKDNQKKSDKKDKDIELDSNNCIIGKVLKGASNKKDLKVRSECEHAIGKVKEVIKKMPDGDYKFFLKLDPEYKSLLNKGNKKHSDKYLVVEIVPKHKDSKYVEKPHKGDRAEVWGAWVLDKPKGWNEIHPAWKVKVIE